MEFDMTGSTDMQRYLTAAAPNEANARIVEHNFFTTDCGAASFRSHSNL